MGKRILVVDDSRFIWSEIRRGVEGTEFEVAGCAKTGEEALQLYRELHPDVVTMDIILPGMDGLDTAKILLENWPEARIVVLSSLAYDETVEETARLGLQGIVFKPFEQEELLKGLRKAME